MQKGSWSFAYLITGPVAIKFPLLDCCFHCTRPAEFASFHLSCAASQQSLKSTSPIFKTLLLPNTQSTCLKLTSTIHSTSHQILRLNPTLLRNTFLEQGMPVWQPQIGTSEVIHALQQKMQLFPLFFFFLSSTLSKQYSHLLLHDCRMRNITNTAWKCIHQQWPAPRKSVRPAKVCHVSNCAVKNVKNTLDWESLGSRNRSDGYGRGQLQFEETEVTRTFIAQLTRSCLLAHCKNTNFCFLHRTDD